jgi:putative CocE/NonD family hydrolase
MADVRDQISEFDYGKKVEKNLFAEMRDGTRLAVDVYRPDAPGRYPALLSITMYSKDVEDVQYLGRQIGRFNLEYSMVEAGDSEFWTRRGYAHVIADVRGTGNSDGAYQGVLSEQEAQDAYDLVEWVASQEWCDGNVGTVGLSYLAINQYFTAAQQPPHLKAIFPHDGPADMYRDTFYHGGIPAVIPWFLQRAIAARNTVSFAKSNYDEDELRKRVDELVSDEATSFGKSALVLSTLRSPPETRPIIFDALVHPEDGPYWRAISPAEVMHKIDVPTYLGAEMHGQSTPVYLGGTHWGWERILAPKKLAFPPHTTGGNHRPFYQFHDEMLRWYDYWLKGIDNGVMDEPAVKVWVRGREEYRYADEWPILSDIDWTHAYLRSGGRLTVGEPPEDHEGVAQFDYEPILPAIGGQPLDPPPQHLSYVTEPFERDVEVVGPLALYLQATLSADNGDFIISVRDVNPDGTEVPLTRGWLRASHREIDIDRSVVWKPFHPHTNPSPLIPNQRYEFAIELRPLANLFKQGHSLKLEIWPCDYPNPDPAAYDWTQFWGFIHHIPYGKQVSYQVHHDAETPSYLLLPVMRN